VLSTYRDLFKLPGAARIASGGFIARMPIAMDAITKILLDALVGVMDALKSGMFVHVFEAIENVSVLFTVTI
jgi:hypothetical protein